MFISFFLDKPGPPRNLQVSEVRKDSCYLTWKEPEDNGGSVITNYVVEKKDVASAQWVPISSSSKKHSLLAKHLMEGTQYLFRVAAENQYGRSSYVETHKPIKAIDPLCKHHSIFIQCFKELYYVIIFMHALCMST